MSELIECVPNFSEGRNGATLQALHDAAESDPSVCLLDMHTDTWHNRSVFTLVGPPTEIERVVVTMARTALERIDLRTHSGAHPRIGATDVVPCVPLERSQMAVCVSAAARIGQRIGEELGVPVFLYGSAAKHEVRRELPNIRRAGLTALDARMRSDPSWRPDFGPASAHQTAGITVVGARPVLIAYNIFLASRDVSIAKRIARDIRAAQGGLPGVRALGFLIDGFAQISMNLVDPDVTDPAAVFNAVQQLAQDSGVGVSYSEFVGLVPQRFMPDDPAHSILLRGEAERHVLERQILKRTQMNAD